MILFLFSCAQNNVNNNIISSNLRNIDLFDGYDKKYKIAVLLPLSGKNSEIGNIVLDGIVMSLFKNDNKSRFEIEIFDNKSNIYDTEIAIDNILKKNIDIVIGPIFTNSLEAVYKKTKDKDITILSLSNNYNLRLSDNIFLAGFSLEQQINKLIDFAINEDKSNFAIVAPNNSFGIQLSDFAKSRIIAKDGKFISSNFYNKKSDAQKIFRKALFSYKIPDYIYEQIEENLMIEQDNNIDDQIKDIQINDSEIEIENKDKIFPNVIIIAESGRFLNQIIDYFKSLQFEEEYKNIYENSEIERDLILSGTMIWDNVININNPKLSSYIFASINRDNFKKFEEDFYQSYNQMPKRIASIGYDLMKYIIELRKRNINENISYLDFIDIDIYDNDIDSNDFIDGKLRFLYDSMIERNYKIYQINDFDAEKIEDKDNEIYKDIFLKY